MNEVNTKLVNAMEGETPVAHKHEGEHSKHEHKHEDKAKEAKTEAHVM